MDFLVYLSTHSSYLAILLLLASVVVMAFDSLTETV